MKIFWLTTQNPSAYTWDVTERPTFGKPPEKQKKVRKQANVLTESAAQLPLPEPHAHMTYAEIPGTLYDRHRDRRGKRKDLDD